MQRIIISYRNLIYPVKNFAEQFSLLYEVNSDKIESLALYGNEGRLIASEPVAVEK